MPGKSANAGTEKELVGAAGVDALAPVLQGALSVPLTAAERRGLRADVRRLLRWQETLEGWTAPRTCIAGMPFVALYARGRLKGCMGDAEGGPGENVGRAFLRSVADSRFGGIRQDDRAALVAEVSYLRTARFVERERLVERFEPGTHGLGLARANAFPVLLLPSVARDGQLDAVGMLTALERKAGALNGGLFVFETETVIVRRGTSPARLSRYEASIAWLRSLVDQDGHVCFGIDARSGARHPLGEMHHARAAAVIDALADHGGQASVVTRARKRLAVDIRAALGGADTTSWPTNPARVAGTLGLALRAGVAIRAETIAYVEAHASAIAAVPWHAAQVVAALGLAAPEAIWRACTADLARQPWAPWTVLAALARGDDVTVEKTIAPLVASVRLETPHRGAVRVTGHAEVALTALTVEALQACRETPATRRAIDLGRSFIRGCQLRPSRLPASFDPVSALGAFVATPTSPLLRGDVSGHAHRALFSGNR